jgi:hypothetical protein
MPTRPARGRDRRVMRSAAGNQASNAFSLSFMGLIEVKLNQK